MFAPYARYYQISIFFFFNDTATTEIYTLSLHDALPIYVHHAKTLGPLVFDRNHLPPPGAGADRKSTRLNSSHSQISYAVFCLKKKKYLERSTIRLNLTLGQIDHWKRLRIV